MNKIACLNLVPHVTQSAKAGGELFDSTASTSRQSKSLIPAFQSLRLKDPVMYFGFI
jgi:hypothetical protein